MRYVIVGNGPAAVGCIEAIRRKDTEGTITLFSKEPEHTYSRPLISYLLEGKTDERRMRYRGPDFYRENGVDVRLGVEATAVDLQTHTATGSDGSTAVYDRLLLATGGRPFVPPAEGLETVAYHTFMTLADARKLEAALTRESRVLIVGAGLIGMKCLEGIRHLVREATVVDLAPHILASILDPEAAAMVQAHVEKQGVTFRLGDSVTRYAPGEALLRRKPFPSMCWSWPWACARKQRWPYPWAWTRLAAFPPMNGEKPPFPAYMPPETAPSATTSPPARTGCWHCCPMPTCRGSGAAKP